MLTFLFFICFTVGPLSLFTLLPFSLFPLVIFLSFYLFLSSHFVSLSLFLPYFRLLFSILGLPMLCSRTRVYNLLYIFRCELVSIIHKVLAYIEYRAVSGVFRPELLTPTPPPLHPASVSSPRTKDGGTQYTLAGR